MIGRTSLSRNLPRVLLLLPLGVVLLGALGFQSADRIGFAPRAATLQQAYMSGPITTVTGDVIETDTLRGRVILVNAWATWCGPCVLEMPGFQRVQDDYKDQGFLVLGISANDEGPEFVRAFIDDLGITYPVVVVPQPSLGHLTAQVRGLPTSILLGPDGRIAKKVEGVFHEEALRAALEELLSSFHHDLVHEEPGIFRGPRMPVWKRSSVPRVDP
jgi:thiol-disulfide isomerase/thioredoxin